MKRQIKFRVWDTVLKTFLIGKIDFKFTECLGYKHKSFIFQQFTGIKDKNGKEIYEGDIVSFNGNKVAIEWNETEALFWGGNNKQRYIFQYADNLEVIGDIFEDSELLK